MRSERIYVATFRSIAIGTAAQSIMEVQVPDNTIIEVLKAWISPAITGTPLDEVISVTYYSNDAAATGGTGMTEQPMSPAAAADPSNCVALQEPAIGATPFDLGNLGYHLQNALEEPPIPEEMATFIGGNADPGDNVGLRLSVTSVATPSVSGGIRWREISAA